MVDLTEEVALNELELLREKEIPNTLRSINTSTTAGLPFPHILSTLSPLTTESDKIKDRVSNRWRPVKDAVSANDRYHEEIDQSPIHSPLDPYFEERLLGRNL